MNLGKSVRVVERYAGKSTTGGKSPSNSRFILRALFSGPETGKCSPEIGLNTEVDIAELMPELLWNLVAMTTPDLTHSDR